MDSCNLTVFWSEEDASFVALCPGFPGISGLGNTAETALEELRAALSLAIEACREEGPLLRRQGRDRYRGQFLRGIHVSFPRHAGSWGLTRYDCCDPSRQPRPIA